MLTFIADFWYIWLVGLLFFVALGLYNWVMGLFKTGGTILKAVNLSAEAVSVVADKNTTVSDKARAIKDRTSEELLNEGKSRILGMAYAGISIFVAALFGIVFFLSVVLNLIDYVKKPTQTAEQITSPESLTTSDLRGRIEQLEDDVVDLKVETKTKTELDLNDLWEAREK
jgi:hypothetical protein